MVVGNKRFWCLKTIHKFARDQYQRSITSKVTEYITPSSVLGPVVHGSAMVHVQLFVNFSVR